MKRNSKKNILLIFFGVLAVFLSMWGNQTFAQQKLEVNYPTIPGVQKPETIETPLSTYLKYIYNLSIIIAGILSFALILWGGIKYITAGPRPAKLADAREQITVAFVGIIIIFASWLMLNTINPELTHLGISLPIDFFSQNISSSSVNPDIPELNLHEVPVGSIITSEYLVSSFLKDGNPDIDYASTTWPASSTPPGQYSTDFQGALYGARLKRIHEVASTTLPVIDLLGSIYEDFMDTVNDLYLAVGKLYSKVMACNCGNCEHGNCIGNHSCDCSSCTSIGCSGDTCKNRDFGKIIEDIKEFYKEKDSPLRCRKAELEYLGNAYKHFIEGGSQLVRNEDHQDESYWYSSEAEDLRNQIENCISAGELSQDRYDKIEEVIWNSTSSMAAVENKGGYTPKTDPLERDVGENLSQMSLLLNAMKRIKRLLNPFDQDVGYLRLMSFAESVTLEQEYNSLPKITPYSVIFGDVLQGNIKTEKVDVKNDPATFYSASALPFPFGPPSDQPIQQHPSEPDYLQNPQWPIRQQKNIAWAQPIPNPDPINFDFDSPPATRSTCNYIVEIPIGRALDEAIKLVEGILRELKNIRDRSENNNPFNPGIINSALDSAKEEGIADKMTKSIEDLITKSSEVPDCSEGCISECKTEFYQKCEDKNGDGDTTDPGECEDHCRCNPGCICNPSEEIRNFKKDFKSTYNKIGTKVLQMKGHLMFIKKNIESIKESFYKLNSENPETGDRAFIGADYICMDQTGNCRKDDWSLDTDKIEEKEYTLKEKLVTVQKLLDMSRELINPQGGKSVYEQLLEELIDLNLIDRQELTYIRKVDAIEKMDLQNCHIFYETKKEITKEEPFKRLLNCRDAETLYAIDHFDVEICSPDPYLDANYFFATSTRDKRPLSCYCYDEDADRNFYNRLKFPELYNLSTFLGFGNNYYCCIKESEK